MILSPYRAVSAPGLGQNPCQPRVVGSACPVSRAKEERQNARAIASAVFAGGGVAWPQPPWPVAYTSRLCDAFEHGTSRTVFALALVVPIRHWRAWTVK